MESVQQPPVTHTFEFRGQTAEFFRIWIVNTLLTILTLGIYSAWAKVRTRRYFYKNTYLAGSSFDYHADPKKILKGRVILFLLLILYSASSQVSVFATFGIMLLIGILLPWVLVRGAIFNARNSSFRNIRFDFQSSYLSAYKSYIIGALATVFTFGLGYPYLHYKHYKFLVDHTRLGDHQAEFNGKASSFFAILLGTIVVYFVLALVSGLLLLLLRGQPVFSAVAIAVNYIGLALAAALWKSQIPNVLADHSKLGPITFYGRLYFFDMAKIYLTNLIAIVCTLGLATPWAMIRARKYRVEHIDVFTPTENTFDEITGSSDSPSGHIADAATDFWDIDFGI